MNTFNDFGLLPSILKTLKSVKIYNPTEIQQTAIPLLMSGQSVVGVAETGSGKTLTYALPILHLLKTLEADGYPVEVAAKPRAVILVPSRDLGEQVTKVFKNYTHDTRLRLRSVLGGTTLEQSRRNIESPFEVLLATPGRLIQLMEKRLIDLSDVLTLVFDEADQMLDDGFIGESKAIVQSCPDDLQLALFSATISKQVEDLIKALFKNAEMVKTTGAGKVVKTLITKNEIVLDGQRWLIFEKLLKNSPKGGTIVFTNTREQCDKLAEEIRERGFVCAVYRGEMDKSERRNNLKSFRNGEVDLLISTDLAARGLDVESVSRVINFHLPKEMANYLHRAGRTARGGKTGLVVNLITERDLPLMGRLKGISLNVEDLKKQFRKENGQRRHLPEELRPPRKSKQKKFSSNGDSQKNLNSKSSISKKSFNKTSDEVKTMSKKTSGIQISLPVKVMKIRDRK